MWEAYRRTLKDHLRTPSWGRWYVDHRDVFSTALTELVEEALEELEVEGAAT
jgi:hypothetical protein